MKQGDNVHVFRILDEVSKGGDLTQRTLSQRLGVALGLTNLYVRRLTKKGLIKVVNLKPHRLRYELTPSGIAQKTSLAFQYIQESYFFYREARKSMTKTFDGMKAAGARSVVLYGKGDLAEIALLSLQEAHLDVAAIVCDGKAGQALCGRPILGPETVSSLTFDHVIVVDSNAEESVRVLSAVGVDASRIMKVGV
ncbi:MAG: winged helix-turn-helix transcriptional regulator [Nitrospirota bacterium]